MNSKSGTMDLEIYFTIEIEVVEANLDLNHC